MENKYKFITDNIVPLAFILGGCVTVIFCPELSICVFGMGYFAYIFK
jgi:hypothetical protein